MKSINRRGFLRTGITGAAAMAVTPSIISASSLKSGPADDIIYRTLGKTGMKVPVISFGVMRADNPGLCKAAYEKGIKLFDTANGYQNGNNETMLGNLLKDYPRKSFFLATKVPPGTDREGKPTERTTAEAFLEKFKVSLTRLQMDYVDILYIHDISNPELLEFKPIINAVRKLKKEGKIKFMGFSTHRNEPAVIAAASAQDYWDVILTSYNYRQTYSGDLQAAIKKAASAGIGIVAMKTLAGGGFLDKEKTKPMNTTAAIKWALSNPDITTAIPGMTAFDHLDLNVRILPDISLTEGERKDLLLASANQGMFCNGCSTCTASCPKNLPVPDIMRAYMYAYGYSNPAMAHSLLSDLGIDADPCSGCDSCKISCVSKFNIKEKIADISRLVNVPSEFLA
jgi:uncharacterized protein